MKKSEFTMSQTYFLYGFHSVVFALQNPQRHIRELVLSPAAREKFAKQDLESLLQGHKVRVLDPKAIDSLAGEAVHQGCLLYCEPLPRLHLDQWLTNIPHGRMQILVLDHVVDPQNIGALLRTSAAFSVGAMIVHDRHCPPNHTPSLIKAACGGAERVPLIRVGNVAQALETLKTHDFWCLGLSEHATQDFRTLPNYERIALVLGSEGQGVRSLVSQKCDLNLKLPTNALFSTLNVSVAGAVALTLIQSMTHE